MFAQVVGVLVDREARAGGGQLEQHPARLAEVDAQEVLAVDDGRGALSGLDQARAPGLVLVVAIAPGDVVDGAGALEAGRGRRVVVAVVRSTASRQLVLAGGGQLEPHDLGQDLVLLVAVSSVRADAVEALEGKLGRDVVRVGGQRLVLGVHDRKLEIEPFGVVEPDRIVAPFDFDALGGEALGPEGERVGAGHAPAQPVDHPGPGAPRGRVGEFEEGQDRPGRAALVAEVQVVDVRGVEVDRLLDQAHAEHARVEVHVAGRVGGDAGDVVDPVQLHSPLPVRGVACQLDKAVKGKVVGGWAPELRATYCQ